MGGYQQLVRGDVMRGKFRNSFEKPEPFTPGEPTQDQVHAARRLPHVPARPPHHGAGAEHLVPAGRPQPADVLRHLHGERIGLQKANASHLPRQGAPVEDHLAGVEVNAGVTAILGAEERRAQPDLQNTLVGRAVPDSASRTGR